MLTCKEVSRGIASDELERAGWGRCLAVRLHLLMCRHCRRYAAQIRAIGAAAKSLFERQEADVGTLKRLEKAILDNLSKGKPNASEHVS